MAAPVVPKASQGEPEGSGGQAGGETATNEPFAGLASVGIANQKVVETGPPSTVEVYPPFKAAVERREGFNCALAMLNGTPVRILPRHGTTGTGSTLIGEELGGERVLATTGDTIVMSATITSKQQPPPLVPIPEGEGQEIPAVVVGFPPALTKGAWHNEQLQWLHCWAPSQVVKGMKACPGTFGSGPSPEPGTESEVVSHIRPVRICCNVWTTGVEGVFKLDCPLTHGWSGSTVITEQGIIGIVHGGGDVRDVYNLGVGFTSQQLEGLTEGNHVDDVPVPLSQLPPIPKPDQVQPVDGSWTVPVNIVPQLMKQAKFDQNLRSAFHEWAAFEKTEEGQDTVARLAKANFLTYLATQTKHVCQCGKHDASGPVFTDATQSALALRQNCKGATAASPPPEVEENAPFGDAFTGRGGGNPFASTVYDVNAPGVMSIPF